jgi:hypothetical protein
MPHVRDFLHVWVQPLVGQNSQHVIENVKAWHCETSATTTFGIALGSDPPITPWFRRIPKRVVGMHQGIIFVVKVGCNNENLGKGSKGLSFHESSKAAPVILAVAHGTVLYNLKRMKQMCV